jgi:diguanylate cyclase (GGDEF)-like protein/PAS domain S-box-containing protein
VHIKYSKNNRSAFFISAIFLAVGVIWIMLSDSAISSLAANPAEASLMKAYKEWFFIFTTALILFFLSRKFFHNIHNLYFQKIEDIEKNYKKQKNFVQAKELIESSQIELSKYEKLLHTIINTSPDAIYAKDRDGKYILFNDAAGLMLNVDAQNIVGKRDETLFTPEYAAETADEEKKIIENKKIIKKEEKYTVVGGKEKVFSTTKGALVDERKKVFGIFAIARDMTEHKEHERFLIETKEKFYRLSHLDDVTFLPNRLYMSEVLTQKCSQNLPFALILIDLDNFKIINDSYGHFYGDKILVEISKVLKEVFISTAFIARMVGDEFGIILNSSDKEQLKSLMQKFHYKFNNPLQVDSIDVYITVSSGICLYPDDAKTMLEMYQAADAAMYNAKKTTQNSYSFYDLQFKKDAVYYAETVSNLKQAIEKGEFELYFQPQNNAQTGTIVGMEVLLRWNHKGKMIPPDLFIPVAEKSGLIVEIGNFALRKGFKTAKKWHDEKIAKGRVSINISARQLTHLDFINTLKSMLQESGCEASWIELEITESSVLENPDLVIDLLQKIKALGFHISVDDFGTGYSSLSYLKNLPIDKLKIDRSFIMSIQTEPKNQIIVKTTIFLGNELGIHVLAEGVETEEEHSFLLENKIDSIQGYYYSKPLSLDEFEKLLKM